MKELGFNKAALSAMAAILLALALDWLSPVCPLRAYTGLLCPGCGMTHALRALIAGNFIESFRWNPFLILGVAFAVFAILRGNPVSRRFHALNGGGAAGFTVVIIGFALLRNFIV
jgi:hypothetical protein